MWHGTMCKWSKVWCSGMRGKNTLRWYDHLDRKKNEHFVKKVYVSEIESPRRRGRPVVKWNDRVREYKHERGGVQLYC